MEYGLNHLIIQQVGNKDEDLWQVNVIDSSSYEDIVTILKEGASLDDMESVIDNAIVEEQLCEYSDKQYAMGVAQEYADIHPVCLMIIMPYFV